MATMSSAVHAANTSNIFTANHIAEKMINQTATGVQKKREIFNFLTSSFDLATVAAIVSIAATIFTGSIALAMLSWVTWNVRAAFYEAVVLTGGASRGTTALLERLDDVVAEGTVMQIREHLEIDDRNWNFEHSRILNFTLWLNQVPVPAQQGSAQGAQSALSASAQNAASSAQNAPSASAQSAASSAQNAQSASSQNAASSAQSAESASVSEAGHNARAEEQQEEGDQSAVAGDLEQGANAADEAEFANGDYERVD